jgi:hypothetical protein
VQLIAAHDQLRHEEDRDGRAGFSQR